MSARACSIGGGPVRRTSTPSRAANAVAGARAASAALAITLAGLLTCPAMGNRDAVTPSIGEEIQVVAATPDRSLPRMLRIDSAWLLRVYPTADAGPVWLAPAVPADAVDVALQALRESAARGLDPGNYALADVERALREARSGAAPPSTVAKADVALTAAMLRFMSDLHSGRVRPSDVEPHYRPADKDSAFVSTLRSAVASGRVAEAVDAVEPRFSLYARLVRVLARYRALAQRYPSWPPLPVPAGGKAAPGDVYAGASMLRDRLSLLGDLTAGDAPPSGDRYDEALAKCVERFQRRHGLAPDGVLGMQTLAALDVAPAARALQIALSLERLRWVPAFGPGPLVAINIPSFQLWALADASTAEPPALSMPVIVGKAVRTETPVFLGMMRWVEFSPYWNVPPSILRNEYLGRLRRDPALLAREDMELVPARGDGAPIEVVDEAALSRLAQGTLRLRQRPGAKNALGGVKFVLPNTMDIYLHATPARALFERTRRDFSHGCIRVREPAALARFVLAGLPEWTPAAIDAAMAAGTTRTVPLAAPIPVVVFYTTAIVDASDQAHFLADVYGHDRKLADALERERGSAR